MAYLSRDDIEQIADQIIAQYRKAYLPERYMCYCIDTEKLAHLLGYRIQYHYLSKDGSILGQTASTTVWTTVLNSNMEEVLYLLDGKTILIERRLLEYPQSTGRRNFTIAHELAHQIINRQYPETYGPQRRVFCDYRRSSKVHKKVTDWREWQADALASALLLPLDAIKQSMFMCGLGEKMEVLSPKYSQYKYERFCDMAEYLKVSKSALAFRMEYFGLLDRNRLLIEAAQRKGAKRYDPNRRNTNAHQSRSSV